MEFLNSENSLELSNALFTTENFSFIAKKLIIKSYFFLLDILESRQRNLRRD